jgi:radical SAM superfamily enzyme YgiQ (UPF0313 family)
VHVLLVSTYELGNQPLSVAKAAAAVESASHEARAVDVAVDQIMPEDVDWADRVAFSVPMHTAMRLALQVAESVRARRPELPLCFFGLYATMSRDLTIKATADAAIAGEYESGLIAWLDGGDPGPGIQLARRRAPAGPCAATHARSVHAAGH